MAQVLEVTLHDGLFHSLFVPDGYEIPAMNPGEFVQFVGADGTTLTVHANTIQSVLVKTTAFSAHFPASEGTVSPDDPPKES